MPRKRDVLTLELARDIRRRYAAGETQKVLAEAFGVTQEHVSKIVRNLAWKEVA